MSKKQWPIDPTFHGDTIVVGQIWEEKLQDKIQVGDRILSINDVNTEHIKPCDLLTVKLLENMEKAENKDKKVIRLTLKKKHFK